ncbi:MAG: polysaccharide biosynthesis protein [Phycisphaerales bacterium]|nr:polysaccharide biosynthesis protein [Phycisphaerales bacterium]
MTEQTHEPSRSPSPARACVLIGTGRTCDQLASQLSCLSTPPVVHGCVTCDGRAPSAAVKLLGSIDQAPAILAPLHGTGTMAVVCLPRRLRAVALRAMSALDRAGIPARVVPAIEDLLEGDGAIDPLRRTVLDYSRLIGRTPYGIDRRAVARLIEGRRVLITGAGGSIGSEIAQIAATFAPSSLVLMERAENSLFEINRRIGERFPTVHRAAVLHDVIDAPGTLRHLTALKPDVVFHAAAHKHVPLMEEHPYHAVANNFFGTKSIADAAVACGATRFVLISSDKAVKPTSVMGATKRLAEMYVQALHRSIWARRRQASASGPAASLCMVRFGNVLGSACSVLPIWSSQLSDGGPITVTDPRMTRYFMTIQEAAALVIQSGAIETADPTARVYVLDMGEPVKILDLARSFVRASGFNPVVAGGDTSIEDPQDPSFAATDLPSMEIRLTGARPGEKLHEELAYAAELLQPTPYPGINAWAGPLGDDFSLTTLVSHLATLSPTSDRRTVLDVIRAHVPELPERQTPAQEPKMTTNTAKEPVRDTNITATTA